jgi:pyruvate, water dikinase
MHPRPPHCFGNKSASKLKRGLGDLIVKAHAIGRKVTICGQAPGDGSDFAAFLVRAGIDSISLIPDSVLDVVKRVASVEKDGQ